MSTSPALQSPDDAASITDGLRQAMRRLAASVSVVTLRDAHGAAGATVSALCSLSFEPPSVLIALNQSGSMHDRILAVDTYAINILYADQEEISRTFGAPNRTADCFKPDVWEDIMGAPCLIGAQSTLICRRAAELPHGSHRVIVGEVLWTRSRPEVDPLLYADGGYRRLG
ncbi:flavin reductase (DIM6/NTAB) family NADH-FMN oxidoreductase RutF [Nitrospirillum amazonense]|uniref:Flavin reductase (DIM6/NTAB) family NADH-FMN oxidoreductase RutF n=1 Tax=Nitrospirillum amazonense TaxID=28077 RepID=A0A560F1E1_9PROT|nr:flavin reductase family protein [Nitrospirillum amazonense]TWB15448.1 flavin reductase (DIM6/NTAB) family NADH-FMN oxidoreductase RutF [Nitrospirillum amazonense]